MIDSPGPFESLRFSTLATAGAGTIISLAITRPSSYTETVIATVCSFICAIIVGPELVSVTGFSLKLCVFFSAAFGFALIRVANSLFVRINKDPLAAIDSIVGSLIPWGRIKKDKSNDSV